jgi:putative FmdB family regulatory protein
MPTYEYLCKACQHEWAVEQRITEDAIKVCPSCRKPQAQRQISAGNFILKGGGWYADLYSSAQPSKAAAESSKESKTETSTSEKTESKTETTKPETKKSEPAPAAKTPTTPPKAT